MKLYALTTTNIQPGQKISDVGFFIGTIPTNADGEFSQVIELPHSTPWNFIADYHDGDDYYEPQLDALSTVTTPGQARMAPWQGITSTLYSP